MKGALRTGNALIRTSAKKPLSKALALVFGLTLAAASGPSFARKPAVVNPLHVMADPGDPPPFQEAEYAQYRRGDGTSEVVGTFTLHEPPYTDFHCEVPTLYPATKYTAWLLEKWAYELDGRAPLASGLLYPGGDGMGVSLPAFLEGTYYEPDRAIVPGDCQTSSDSISVYFKHVPVGMYIFVELIERTTAYESHDSKEVTVYGPYGAAPGYIDTPHAGAHPADGFVVLSHRVIVVDKKGYRFTLVPSNINPVAYFQDG